MADDGGSTGILRDEMGVLPPGDVRQCLAALARAPHEVRELFSYRFPQGDLKGHNMGNLFLSALEKITGSFSRAVEEAGRILDVYGKVIPVSEGDMQLVVELHNGVMLYGESKLDDDARVAQHGVRSVSLAHPVSASRDALSAIEAADLVVIGPGDLYGSIAPNLLVGGICEALAQTSARIAVVANVTNKKGISSGFTAEDHARFVEQYIGSGSVDVLVVNTQQPEADLVQKYEAQEGEGMLVSSDGTLENVTYFKDDLVLHAQDTSLIRHDSEKLAEVILKVLRQ
mgnify:CR=1 FL=1